MLNASEIIGPVIQNIPHNHYGVKSLIFRLSIDTIPCLDSDALPLLDSPIVIQRGFFFKRRICLSKTSLSKSYLGTCSAKC
jgi:hypothetical protein